MITPDDDYFHPRNDSPYWNESAWFTFMIPQRRLSGEIYFWHRPNLGLTQSGVTVWDDTGKDVYDCLFHEFDYFSPLPEGADMYDFTADSGLTVRCVEPLQRFRLDYKTVGCEFGFDWEAITIPLEAPRKASEVAARLAISDDDALHASMEGWGRGHYEQGGRMRGRLEIEGEVFDVDDYGVRDHSWGIRRMDHDMPRQAYEWAIASPEHSFLVHAVNNIPAGEDDLDGTVEDELRGWYIRDGVQSEFVEGSRRITARGDDGRQLHVIVSGVDALGRTMHAEATPVNFMQWPMHIFYMDDWSLARWEFDGQTAWGETQDYVQLQQNRKFLKKRRAKAAN